MFAIDTIKRIIRNHGLLIEWTHDSSFPGPSKGGMCTFDTVLWIRVNRGCWWRPSHEYRSLPRFVDAVHDAANSGDILAICQGRKQMD